jgi:hypothetical protein
MKLRAFNFVGLSICALLATACGPKEKPYKQKPAFSGSKPTLPGVPTLPNKAKKDGDAYTIWGASHDLRSRVHRDSFTDKDTTLVGWITKTNFADVPECAVHRTGKGDPPDCHAPVPTFWIADTKDEKEALIPVMGWASNFAQLFSMIEEIDKKEEEAELNDEFFGVALPNPLPNTGAKVKVTGRYSVTYNRSTSGTASNPKYGILTLDKIEYIEKPPEPAILPGMKVKNK